jgi:hypothetical protein
MTKTEIFKEVLGGIVFFALLAVLYVALSGLCIAIHGPALCGGYY